MGLPSTVGELKNEKITYHTICDMLSFGEKSTYSSESRLKLGWFIIKHVVEYLFRNKPKLIKKEWVEATKLHNVNADEVVKVAVKKPYKKKFKKTATKV
jgi:hypothetical protein